MNYNKDKRNPILTEALEAEARTEQAQYFTGETESFSPEFEQQMARLAERTQRRIRPSELLRKIRDWIAELFFGEYRRAGYYGRQRMKRQVVCFMMAAMLVFFTGMAKPPASAGQTKIIIESHNGRHHASIHPQMGYVYPEILEQRFTLSLLPEGYTLTEQWDRWSDLESYTTWTNPQGNKIVLMQDTLNTGLELNVDSAPGKSVRVGRYRGQLFVCQEHIVLLWTTDYTLMLEVYDPKVTPEQVLAMAAGLVEVSAGRP